MRKPKSIDECDYFSKRTIEDKVVMMWVFKGEETLNVEYECPACGHKGFLQLPFRFPIRFACEKCGYKFKLSRLNPRKRRKKKQFKI